MNKSLSLIFFGNRFKYGNRRRSLDRFNFFPENRNPINYALPFRSMLKKKAHQVFFLNGGSIRQL